jgi:hypothetical protein
MFTQYPGVSGVNTNRHCCAIWGLAVADYSRQMQGEGLCQGCTPPGCTDTASRRVSDVKQDAHLAAEHKCCSKDGCNRLLAQLSPLLYNSGVGIVCRG